MTDDTAKKFAAFLAEQATRPTDSTQKKADAESFLLPLGAAGVGAAAGYFGTQDERRKLRNALYGGLFGGATGTAAQLIRNYGPGLMSSEEPPPASATPPGEAGTASDPNSRVSQLRNVADLGAGGLAAKKTWSALGARNPAAAQGRVGELARAGTRGAWVPSALKAKPDPAQQALSALAKEMSMPGATGESAARALNPFNGDGLTGKKLRDAQRAYEHSTKSLGGILDAGHLSADPTTRAAEINRLTKVLNSAAGGKLNARDLSARLDAARGGNKLFNAKRLAAGGVSGVASGMLTDLILSKMQNMFAGSGEKTDAKK